MALVATGLLYPHCQWPQASQFMWLVQPWAQEAEGQRKYNLPSKEPGQYFVGLCSEESRFASHRYLLASTIVMRAQLTDLWQPRYPRFGGELMLGESLPTPSITPIKVEAVNGSSLRPFTALRWMF